MKGDDTGQRAETVTVDASRDGQRLDNFIAARLPGVPRSLVYRVIRTGQVRVNGGRAKPATRLAAGDRVRIPPARISPRGPGEVPDWALQQIEASILAKEPGFLVIDKPSGMAVHGGSGLAWGVIDGLRRQFPDEELELVHRLDRETSGCLLLARDAASLRTLRARFARHEVEKRYLCLLHGRLPQEDLEIDQPLARFERGGEHRVETRDDGKSARTRLRVLERYRDYSFVEAIPETGRTHQIRVHAASVGAPLAGDRKYAAEEHHRAWPKIGLKRLFLHAHYLAFEDAQERAREYSSPLPAELRSVLDTLAPA